ncbi:MAG: ArsR/SmtB family transcription factor [Pigmentiphaga sp.]
MEARTAVIVLAALAQESRLAIFHLLVQAGSEGLPAGEVSKRTGIPPSSLSFHLKELTHAGLTEARQEGRFVYYRVQPDTMHTLVSYLTDHCGGAPPSTTA